MITVCRYDCADLLSLEISIASRHETHEFWCDFIEIYESFPALWKVKSEEYKKQIWKVSVVIN
jgi:hypothetical protein